MSDTYYNDTLKRSNNPEEIKQRPPLLVAKQQKNEQLYQLLDDVSVQTFQPNLEAVDINMKIQFPKVRILDCYMIL